MIDLTMPNPPAFAARSWQSTQDYVENLSQFVLFVIAFAAMSIGLYIALEIETTGLAHFLLAWLVGSIAGMLILALTLPMSGPLIFLIAAFTQFVWSNRAAH